uniref:uncharacterized protein LOC120347387 n=1 Tax=Styela clava TaxID=7725 RepID=UPI00193946E5|nr:uncharacterized protein LOC120347387 [Styela clava]
MRSVRSLLDSFPLRVFKNVAEYCLVVVILVAIGDILRLFGISILKLMSSKHGMEPTLENVPKFTLGSLRHIGKKYYQDIFRSAVIGLKAPNSTVYYQKTLEKRRHHIFLHKSLHDRQSAAEILKDYFSCPLVLDGIENEATKHYGTDPDRMAIIYNGCLEYISAKGPFGFKVEEMLIALNHILQRSE